MDETIDLRGLKCPLPALMAKKALARGHGRITVLADDPMAVVDIPHMCPAEGHAVEAVLREDGLVRTRRDAQTVVYSLPQGPAQRVIDVLHSVYCGVRE